MKKFNVSTIGTGAGKSVKVIAHATDAVKTGVPAASANTKEGAKKSWLKVKEAYKEARREEDPRMEESVAHKALELTAITGGE